MAESGSSKMDDNASSITSKTTDISCLKPKSFRIPSHCESVLDVLNKQRHNGEYCDVSLLVEHQRFTAHKCVLAANSPYFHSVLSNENDGMYLRQVGVDGFSVLLDFMYTSRLRLDPGNIQSVLSAAKVLQVNAAISICCRYLENQLKALTKDLNGNIVTKPNEPPAIKHDGQHIPPPLTSINTHQRQNFSPSYAGDPMPPPGQVNRNGYAKRPERYNGGVGNRSDICNPNPNQYQHHKHRSDNDASRMEQRPADNHPHIHRNSIPHNQYPASKQRFYPNQNPAYVTPSERTAEPRYGFPDKRHIPNSHIVRSKDTQQIRHRPDRDQNEHRSSWTRDYHPNYSISPPPKGDLWDRRREENLLLTRHCSREYQPEYKNTRKVKPYYPKYQQRIT